MLSNDALRGHMDAILLRRMLERDRYGYELFSEIKQLSAGKLIIKEATLYATLQRLEKQKCITSYQGEVSGGSKRRYYHITAAGRELLRGLQGEWLELKEILKIFLEE